MSDLRIKPLNRMRYLPNLLTFTFLMLALTSGVGFFEFAGQAVAWGMMTFLFIGLVALLDEGTKVRPNMLWDKVSNSLVLYLVTLLIQYSCIGIIYGAGFLFLGGFMFIAMVLLDITTFSVASKRTHWVLL